MAAGRFSYGNATLVDAPAFTPVKGGLLDVAEVRTVSSGDPSLRGYFFETTMSEVALGTVSGFVESSTAPMTEGAGYTYVNSSDPFTIFGAAALDAGGGETQGTIQERAVDRLTWGESLAVEQAVWNGLLVNQAQVVRGTATKSKLAVGLLSEWFAESNLGVGYFHTGRRGVNEIAAQQLVQNDAPTASLKGGGVLINGAGYFAKTTIGGITPTADQVWVIITGAPLLYRGAVNSTVAYGGANASGSANNRIAAYALRTYVPSVDGPVGAVLVDLTL